MADQQTIVDANGIDIPQIGLGTWPMKGEECRHAVESALELGYRHIDTAQMYDNEKDVGAAIAASGLDRGEIFLTTKIWPDTFRAPAFADAVKQSLDRLATDHVDLLLLHWPSKVVPLAETIPALNAALTAGQTRAIGVSNFNVALIHEAARLSDARLAVNQVEYHPFVNQAPVLEACAEHGMAMTAYCPIAKGQVTDSPVIAEIAGAKGRTAVQVALRWLIQQGVIAIPKSATRSRIADNLDVFSFSLSDDEMARISGCARPDGRMVNVVDHAPEWDT